MSVGRGTDTFPFGPMGPQPGRFDNAQGAAIVKPEKELRIRPPDLDYSTFKRMPRKVIQAAQAILEAGCTPQEIAQFHVRMMRGEEVELTQIDRAGGEYAVHVTPTVSERQSSANWLAERLWGKVKDVGPDMGVGDDAVIELKKVLKSLPDNELEQVGKLMAKKQRENEPTESH